MRGLIAFWCAAVFLLAGCESKKGGGPVEDTATSGTMSFIADEDLKPAIDSLVVGFNAENPAAHVSVSYLPATQALDALLSRKSRLVIIGRPLNAKEHQSLASQHVELTDFDMALNGVICVSSRASGLTELAFPELRDNIQGVAATYTQVIDSYLSSTEAILDSMFLADTSSIKGKVVRYSTVDSLLDHVKKDPHSIAYLSSAWLTDVLRDTSLKVLDLLMPDSATPGMLKPVMFHLSYLFLGKYPLGARVMGYTMEPVNTLPRGFLAYAMSANGQKVFLLHNLLPRTQIIRLVPPRK